MVACPVCNTESSMQRINTPYWICSSCELWFQSPPPVKIFEGMHEKDAQGNFIGHLMSDYEKGVNKELATWLFNKIGLVPGNKTLDIGAKYPYLAYCFKQLKAEAYAMDNLEEVPEFSKELGVPLIMADFEEWNPGIEHFNQYKLITMVHCFEHMYNPKSALLKIHELLTADGVFYIRSPANDVTGIERDLIDSHYKIHPYIHSINSIAELLLQLKDKFIVTETVDALGIGQRDLILKKIEHAPTIYAGVIEKNEERDLPVLLDSIKDCVDGIVAVDTGSTDSSPVKFAEWQIANPEKYVECFNYLEASEKGENGEWQLLDFSKARNRYVSRIENFSHVDWLLWVDADDKILNPRGIRRISYLKCYDTFTLRIMLDNFPQHKMWKNGLGIKYEGACHEYPTIGGFKCLDTQLGILHNYAPGSGETSNARNLRILEREYKNNPEPSSRTLFYLAQTYHHGGQFAKAVEIYSKRLEKVDYRDEWLFTWLYKARCERATGQNDAAIKTLYRGIAEEPGWAEYWTELAYILYENKEWQKTISSCMQALSCKITETSLWRERNKYLDQPLRLISFAYEGENRKQLALDFAIKAKKYIYGPDADWDKRIEILSTKRIALHRPGAIGDVLMTLNLLPLLKKKYPKHKIDYYCSEFIANNLGNIMKQAGIDEVYGEKPFAANYEKVIDLIGYPLAEGYPWVKMKKHLIEYFADEMGLEIKSIPHLILPIPEKEIAGGYISIHPKSGWSQYKNWPISNWAEVIKQLPGHFFVQVGDISDPAIPGINYFSTNLSKCIGIVANAAVHVGIDSYTNHLTNFIWKKDKGFKTTPAVILWGSTQWNAAGYNSNINISKNISCQPCFREDAPQSTQRTDPCPNSHQCMNEITVDEVVTAIKEQLKKYK